MKSLTSKYGASAVVTGATSGIGRRFAACVAEAGMNVVLLARCQDALQKTPDELQSRYAVQTRVLALNLTDTIARETLDLETRYPDIGLLLNNAAVEQQGGFVRHSTGELHKAIELNVTAPTDLGQRFGQRFVKRGMGGIIFGSGSIGYQAVPYLAHSFVTTNPYVAIWTLFRRD